jgi:hypothetical protein
VLALFGLCGQCTIGVSKAGRGVFLVGPPDKEINQCLIEGGGSVAYQMALYHREISLQ